MVIEYKNKERIAKNCDSKKTNKNKKTKLDSLNDYGKKDVKWSVKKYRSSQIERVYFKFIVSLFLSFSTLPYMWLEKIFEVASYI